jgi:molybdopterin converting factor small subunit
VSAAAPSTVRVVLETVTRDQPKLAAEIWRAPGELNEFIHVFVNGRETRYLPQGLDTPLQPQDALDVFPPVGGGEHARLKIPVGIENPGRDDDRRSR